MEREAVAAPIYEGGFKGRWQDWGWAPRDTEMGKPARLNFANYAGWRLANRGEAPAATSLRFHLQAPSGHGDFLEVRLGGDEASSFPKIAIDAAHRRPSSRGPGWLEVRVGMAELNPQATSFSQVLLHAHRNVGADWVSIDGLAFYSDGSARSPDASPLATGVNHPSRLRIDCGHPGRPISPEIYGIAYSPRKNVADAYQWRLGATGRRWGGNPASRYNPRLGNAWNTASDWFYTNVNYSGDTGNAWESFLNENRQHGVHSAVTVPMLGWVAKDTQSYSYPVTTYGPQRGHGGPGGDAGNGVRQDGTPILDADPKRTSIVAGPELVGEWVANIRRSEAKRGGRTVTQYILDNEPALWNSTHRDVHPEPLGYDELLRRTIAYASQVRLADPNGLIAGPAEWGWPAYFFSAADAAAGFKKKPDRLAHGDMPLLQWYLQQLRAHEQRTGQRLLDIVDVHFYPQLKGIYGHGEHDDANTGDRRIRSTRSLWDPSYRDESWINDVVRLLPRLRELIAESYPGLQISIGEYNFGGEKNMSGAIALAETLGRFGQEGVYSAYYWTYPPDNSPAFHAFRAFRNYDGQGAQFLERSLPTTGDSGTSIFASQNTRGDRMVAILLNLDPREGAEASLELSGCGKVTARRAFQYTDGPEGLKALPTANLSPTLPPYSVTVLELERGP